MTADPNPELRPRTVLRLPGSVAEVAASPVGPQIGAFFDLDGTLVAGMTGAIHTKDRIKRREMGVGEIVGMLQAAVDHRLGRLEFDQMIRKGVSGLRGQAISDLDEYGERLFQQKISALVYPEMRELVKAHLARGHRVVLSSSATSIQVEPVARYLGIDTVLCNRFVVDEGGMLTGEVETPILWGAGKANVVQAYAAEAAIDLAQSYFYADGDEDVALMYLVGHPRPTNPGDKLAAVAKKRGWPVLRFTSRGNDGRVAQARNLIGLGSVVPIAAGALGVGLLTRNRRRGVNFLTSTWPGLMLTVNGVRLRVVGAENLTAARPAVFTFNHRNNFDVFIVAALVRDNWTGVAKKEAEGHPISGRIGRLVDAAFIERDDPRAAVKSLKKVEELARKGLSILIAPEGTRCDTTEVGPFKKGPFRIAMSAKVPIVPIVIRNAESIAARDASSMNPGTVDVAVLPPIYTDDWRLTKLSEHIDAVREEYLRTLRDWPPIPLTTADDTPPA